MLNDKVAISWMLIDKWLVQQEVAFSSKRSRYVSLRRVSATAHARFSVRWDFGSNFDLLDSLKMRWDLEVEFGGWLYSYPKVRKCFVWCAARIFQVLCSQSLVWRILYFTKMRLYMKWDFWLPPSKVWKCAIRYTKRSRCVSATSRANFSVSWGFWIEFWEVGSLGFHKNACSDF